jgi:hypothetical protein
MSARKNGNSAGELPDEERDAGQLRLSHEDFTQLSLAKVAELTGLEAPADEGDAAAVADFRERAWESYQVDVQNRDEWGTARQGIPLPE